MPIKRSVDDLATPRGSSQKGAGWQPDAAVRFASLLAEKWHRENMEAGERPHAIEGTRFRHSDAGGCARKIAYKAAGIAATDPMDVTGSWNTRLGTLIHDAWQEALQEAYPGASVEVTSQAFDEGSGSMDALVTTYHLEDGAPGPNIDRVVSYELKTVGGYKFKAATGKIRRGTPPEGPSPEHILQASLNALAHNADEVVIGYLAKETLSKTYDDVADVSKFTAEWTIDRATYEPLARTEIERVEGILRLLDTGLLASRKVPSPEIPGEIVDPSTSRWEVRSMNGTVLDTGSAWNGSFCTYCAFFSLCVQTPSGRVPVEQVVEISERS